MSAAAIDNELNSAYVTAVAAAADDLKHSTSSAWLAPGDFHRLVVRLPSLGSLRGRLEPKHGNARYFLNVPYGSAERWELPVPIKPWQGVRDASEFGPICPQLHSGYVQPLEAHVHALGLVDRSADHIFSRRPANEVQSEDCLNLNVITPCWNVVEAAAADGGLPVIVWIHGGSFRQGHANHPTYTDSPLPHREKCILITVNYRTGIFGFMGAEEMKSGAGNFGLHDVALALRFIKANVRAFGGNPDRITLLGESAGAIISSYILLDPSVSVDCAILLSGSIASVVPKELGKPGDDSVWSRLVSSCLADSAPAQQPDGIALPSAYSSPLLKPVKNLEASNEEPMSPTDLLGAETGDDAATLFTPSPPLLPTSSSSNTNNDTLSYMKSLSHTTLLAHQEKIEAQGTVTFAPHFDGELIAKTREAHPFTRMSTSKIAKVNRVVFALVKDEGTMFVPDLPLSNPQVLDGTLATILPNPLLQTHAKLAYGLNEISSETDARAKAAELIGDMAFNAPTFHAIRSFSSLPNPPEIRLLMHRRPFRFSPFAETWGCHHSSILPFIFASDPILTESERVLAKELGGFVGRAVRGEVDPASGNWAVAEQKIEIKEEDEVFPPYKMGRIELWLQVAAGLAAMQCA